MSAFSIDIAYHSCDDAWMGYPGGKSGNGVYQRLINEIPPHSTYIAAFAGRDAIARHKRPADLNILIDLDPEPLNWWSKALDDRSGSWSLHHCDGIEWLRHQFGLTSYGRPTPIPSALQDSFVFLDPPYLMSTRTGGKIYKHEMTDKDHLRLLDVIRLLPCKVMICGYWSYMYADLLSGWREISYTSVARSGEVRDEYAWMNYPPPETLHDASYVGNNKREREKLRRRIRRLSANLLNLHPHERQAVIDKINLVQPSD